jgi:hypothetical protein
MGRGPLGGFGPLPDIAYKPPVSPLCDGVFIRLNADLILENDVRELGIPVLWSKHCIWQFA